MSLTLIGFVLIGLIILVVGAIVFSLIGAWVKALFNGAPVPLSKLVALKFASIPYGLIVAELGAAFTEEGGAYIWTRMAWGRLVAGLNAIFYWFSNPVWIGATLALLAVAAIQNYIWHFDDGSWAYYLVGLVYIWFSVWSAILSFGVGKWIPTIGAWCRIVVIGLFCAVATWIILKLIDATIGLRVSRDEETEGLDTALHGERVQ